MKIIVSPTPEEANTQAADCLAGWLESGAVRTLMVAAGNTPLALYRLIAQRQLSCHDLNVFALDEYVGVPKDESRNCANLLRRTVAQAWGLAPDHFHEVSSLESEALKSVQAHERRIALLGGLDAIVLGLGQNGHLGFNEPGSRPDSVGRVLDLQPVSVEANRLWFGGHYSPNRGVTVGLKTILEARRVLILAYGTHKAAAVQAMVKGPVSEQCPASFLQPHPATNLYLDAAAAARLEGNAIGVILPVAPQE